MQPPRALGRSFLLGSVYVGLGNWISAPLNLAIQILIARMLGPESVTDFEMGNKFFLQLAALMYGVGAVVMPEATRLRGEGDERALEHVYLKWSKVSFSVVLPICLYLTILGPGFLAACAAAAGRAGSGGGLAVRAARESCPALPALCPLVGVVQKRADQAGSGAGHVGYALRGLAQLACSRVHSNSPPRPPLNRASPSFMPPAVATACFRPATSRRRTADSNSSPT